MLKHRRRAREAVSREYLLDVSRLIWRTWRGALPTGIDRVCLEYVAHFGSRSHAVVQYKGKILVLSPNDSDRLFSVLLRPGRHNRLALAAAAPLAWARSSSRPPRDKMLYLNVGHTGLHDAALPKWITGHDVCAVYLIHDLIPITHPQFCRAGEDNKHASRMEHALASATAIIGNSQSTLDDLSAFAAARGIPMPASSAVWISGQHACGEVEPRKLDRPYFVTVGTIEGRKNHLLLLNVWRRLVADLGDRTPILLIVGQRGWQADEVFAILDAETQLTSCVRELSACADAELNALVAGARALLMPSVAEGFGLPVVEALQLGTPVIASELPVYREIVGDIPTYLDPADEAAWASTIRDFIHDCPERQRQKQTTRSYLAPKWAEHFAKVDQLLANLDAA